MPDQPTITVVIPTLNRSQAIVDAVQDLLAQTHKTFNIIAVDASDENNIKLQDMAEHDQRLRVLRIEQRGTCFARNSGVAAATGEIVVFVDDDVRIPNQRFLELHAQQYSDPTVGGVGGRVLDVNQNLNKEQSGPVCMVSRTGRVFPNATSMRRQDINAPRGGNMSFRRRIISQVGGFDEHFRGNAMREETDFSLRVVRAGWRIVYEPEADLTHLALAGGSRSRDRLTWYRDFFFNESYFFLKNFPSNLLLFLLLRKLRPILACWLYYGRGNRAWFVAPWQSFTEAKRLANSVAPPPT